MLEQWNWSDFFMYAIYAAIAAGIFSFAGVVVTQLFSNRSRKKDLADVINKINQNIGSYSADDKNVKQRLTDIEEDAEHSLLNISNVVGSFPDKNNRISLMKLVGWIYSKQSAEMKERKKFEDDFKNTSSKNTIDTIEKSTRELSYIPKLLKEQYRTLEELKSEVKELRSYKELTKDYNAIKQELEAIKQTQQAQQTWIDDTKGYKKQKGPSVDL